MFSFGSTNPQDLGNGGTIDGDLVITGDLQVSGGGSLSFDEIIEGTQVIDVTSTEALLVRKNSDGGDIFTVNTTDSLVTVTGSLTVTGTLTASDDIVITDELRPYEIRSPGTGGIRLANSQGGIVGYLGLRSSGNYGSGLKLEDDIGSIIFGSDSDYSIKYDSTSDALEIIEGITSASETVLFSINSDSVISLSNNDSGTGNTLFGKDTGDAIASGGNYNVAMGQDALGENTTADASTAIGYESQLAQNGGYNTTVGYQSMKLTGGGSCYSNVGIGSFALYRHSGQYAVAIGEAAGYTNSAHYTTAIGAESLRNNTDGQFNTAVGYGSLKTNIDGDKNTAIGYKSLFTFEADTDGHGGNSALGWESGMDLTTGTQNTLIGENSGGNLTDGDQNTALGSYALAQTIAGSSNNTALGFYACGAGDITNGGITAVGAYALAENVGGQKNVAVGFQAGNVLTAGSQNTIVGYDADTDDNSATNQTVIGSEATGVADNSVTLGNASVTAVYMAQDSGAMVHSGGLTTSGAVLTQGMSDNRDRFVVTDDGSSYKGGFTKKSGSMGGLFVRGSSSKIGILTNSSYAANPSGDTEAFMISSADASATFGGIVDITDTTDASDDSGDTGALRVEGGASIAKKLYVGGSVSLENGLDVSAITTLKYETNSMTLTRDGGHLMVLRNSGSAIADGEALGYYRFNGKVGSSDEEVGVSIQAEADGAWTNDTDCPARLEIHTNSGSSVTERMRIDKDGVITLGLNNASATSVGIGASPSVVANTTKLNMGSSSTAVSQIRLIDNEATDGWYLESNLNFAIGYNTTDVINITQAGVIQLDQGQLKFPASQNASADANTLDDYEEGTWTPLVAEYNDINDVMTMSSDNIGRYTKIGDIVTCTAYVATTANNTCDNVHIGIHQLPFTVVNNLAGRSGLAIGEHYNLNIASGKRIGGQVISNTTKIYLLESNGNDYSTLTRDEWSADGIISFSVTYKVA